MLGTHARVGRASQVRAVPFDVLSMIAQSVVSGESEDL